MANSRLASTNSRFASISANASSSYASSRVHFQATQCTEACVDNFDRAKRRKIVESLTVDNDVDIGIRESESLSDDSRDGDESFHSGAHSVDASSDEARIDQTSCGHCSQKYGDLTTRCCVSCAQQKHPEWHQARIAETRCEHCPQQRVVQKYGDLTTRCCVSCAQQKHPEWRMGWKVSRQCKSSHCETFKSKHLDGYCAPCFRNVFPLDKRARWSRSKEVAVLKFLSERFPDLDWSFNKTIPGGTSRRRPDAFAKLPDRALSIEVDEFSHIGYECICESRKVMEHFEDAGRLPHLFVRFNPDRYTDAGGVKVPSCWGKTPKTQEPRVAPKQALQWCHRLEKLAQIVQHFFENRPDREVSVVELFYH